MLQREALYSLEQYEELRPQLRAKVMAHKQQTTVDVGAHMRLYFEDEMTIQYQVQEMLRAEKIFTKDGIEEELETYNPLISRDNNIIATMMMVYPNVAERTEALLQLVGVEEAVWLEVSGHDKVMAIADEDLERADEDKTSAVHFLRFTLSDAMRTAMAAGAQVQLGVTHPHYSAHTDVDGAMLLALLKQNRLSLE